MRLAFRTSPLTCPSPSRSNRYPAPFPSKASWRSGLSFGEGVRLAGDGEPVPLARDDTRFRAAGKGLWVAEAPGFNVHAGVTVRAGDREGLERLCR